MEAGETSKELAMPDSKFRDDRDRAHLSSPLTGDRDAVAGTPGRRTLTAGTRMSPQAAHATRVATARAALEDARELHLPALRSSIANRSMKDARAAATALRRSLETIDDELRGAEQETLAAQARALHAQAEPLLALAPPPAPEVPMIGGWIPSWTGGLPESDAADEAETERAWRARLDGQEASTATVIPFPHRDHIAPALGGFAGRAVLDPDGCARQGVPAFTEDDVAHFASDAPELEVAAHEAAHVLQHAGLTRDAGLGAEGHAHAVADIVVGGGSAAALLGDAGAPVAGRMHAYSMPSVDVDDDTVAEIDSRVPEKTKAKKERAYKPKGNLGVAISDTEYRFWGFDVGSAAVRGEFRKTLERISERWIDDHRATIHVTGHTSASGAEKHNEGLGLQRAEAIEQELRLLALLRQPVVTHSAGEKHPLVDESKGPAAMARNRRVEVFVMPGAARAKSASSSAPQGADADNCDVRARDPDDRCIRSTAARTKPDECDDSDFQIHLAQAQIDIWGDPASQNLVQPQLSSSGGELYYQPTVAQWWAACIRNGISDADRDAHYGHVVVRADALAVRQTIKRLEDDRDRLISMCGKPKSASSSSRWRSLSDNCREPGADWCREGEPWREGYMPGDTDKKGHLH